MISDSGTASSRIDYAVDVPGLGTIENAVAGRRGTLFSDGSGP